MNCKLFVTHSVAVKLKGKGFNLECPAFYAGDPLDSNYVWRLNRMDNMWHTHTNNTTTVIAPLWIQVVEWFIEKHELFLSVGPNHSGWYWSICKTNGTLIKQQDDYKCAYFDSHYAAMQEAVLEGLKLI